MATFSCKGGWESESFFSRWLCAQLTSLVEALNKCFGRKGVDIGGQLVVSAAEGLEMVKRGNRITSIEAIAEFQVGYDGELV